MRGEWRTLSKGALILFLFALGSPALAQDKAAEIDALMSRYYEYRQFNGAILVADRGKVIYKKGLGLANMEWNIPNSPDTKFRLGSITKQFTAALVLQLAEEGKINLQGKICDYLPDYPRKAGERITVHQLLVHTSGIPSYTGLPDFIEQKSRDPYTPGDFIKVFSHLDLEFEPGSKFSYNNSGYFLLGAIIEKITGQTYEKALEERIFKPLKMTSSGYDHHNTILERRAGAYNRTPDGFENAPYLDMSIPYSAGALYSTVEDLFLWDQALYTDKPVSAKYKVLMFKPNLESYGYGVFIRKEPVGKATRTITVVGHVGGINGFNTLIERLVEDKHLIVLLNNTGGTKLGEMSQSIRKILYSEPHKEPQKPISQSLYKTILELGVGAAVNQYRELKANQPEVYDFGEFELEFVGRHLLKIKKNMEAIQILKLNVESHPKIPMVYDSLGDAYRASGKKELAIKSYSKALELDSNNRNFAEKIKNLTSR